MAGYDESELEALLTEDLPEAIRRPSPRPWSPSLYRPPTPARYVTHTEFRQALDRVESGQKTTNAAVNTLSDKVTALTAQVAKTKKEGRSGREMAFLLPLLMQPKAKDVAAATAAGDKVLVDSGTDMILPLVLLLGAGTDTGGTGGMDQTMLLAVVLMSMRK